MERNQIESEQLKTRQRQDEIAFFFNGLLNNFTYVIFLSAASDIVGNKLPKASVLIADILPAFLVKLILPYHMHLIPYAIRIPSVILTSVLSLLLVGCTTSLSLQFLGIILASAGSGLGEITFLALASFYKGEVVAYWSSGTGGAGVAGSFCYLVLSTWLKLSPGWSMGLSAIFPLCQLFIFFRLMSHPYLDVEKQRVLITGNYENSEMPIYNRLENEEDRLEIENEEIVNNNEYSLYLKELSPNQRPEEQSLKLRIKLVQSLIPNFMLPLFLVFWAEYTINQGIAPTLLFPIELTPFKGLREHYVYYQFFYQLGVFISRSSSTFFPIDNLWLLVLFQLGTLLLLLLQALQVFQSTLFITFLVMIWEGLFGGATYANAFRKLNCELPSNWREFSMGAASVADSLGITLASFTAFILEPLLCNFQKSSGVELCSLING